jgi:hypothetical protein
MVAKNESLGNSQYFAKFLSDTRWEDIPSNIRHEAKRSILNFFACSLGGCQDDVVGNLTAALRPFSGQRVATVIGRQEKIDPLNAAFLNAVSANVFDFDDTHTPTIIHPTAPVAPALFAFAETTRISGAQLLLSFILGVEAECRIGNAVSPGHYRKGWHITSTCGVFGAAIAIGKIIGLSAERMIWALGNASAQSGGLLETLGTMAKSISVGNASRNGYLAALYAQQGVSGPESPLEGSYGFFNVLGINAKSPCIINKLGEHWELISNTYKPYPCGVVLNPVIEACLSLANNEHMSLANIDRIVVTGNPLLRERTDRIEPHSGREAQVSLQHCVAVVLSNKKAGLAEFSDACTIDPTLKLLREKVFIVDDDNYVIESALVTIYFQGGKILTQKTEEARGSFNNPLSDADLEKKLSDLVYFSNTSCDKELLIDAIWSLEKVSDAGKVIALAAGNKEQKI